VRDLPARATKFCRGLALATATAASLLASVSPVGAAKPATRQFGDWIATCDNTLSCSVVEANSIFAPFRLEITREAGASQGPVLKLQVSAALWPSESARQFTVSTPGRLKSSLTFVVTNAAGFAISPRNGAAAIRFIHTLAASPSALLPAGQTLPQNTADAGFSVSLAGLRRALRWVDEHQGRQDASTALAAVGSRRDFTVVRQLPWIRSAASVSQSDLPATPARLRASVAQGCDPFPEGANALVARLSAHIYLWAIPCMDGAYNRGYRAVLADARGRGVRSAGIGLGEHQKSLAGLIFNPGFDAAHMTLKSRVMDRALADCGEYAAFVWTGRAFEEAWDAAAVPCEGLDISWWPTLRRARLIGAPANYLATFSGTEQAWMPATTADR